MTNQWMSRGMFLVAALAFTACPSGNKCVSNADCMTGQVCSVASGTCVAGTGGGMGGGGGTTGGGSGGGAQGGGGGGTDGGMMITGGETCGMAETITAGIYTGSTVGKANDYTNGCGAENPGPEAVYKISVPAGQRLAVTATPQVDAMGNQFDLALYLVQGPASNCTAPDGGDEFDCLSGADAIDPTAVERASYVNNTAAPVEVLIVIDSYFAMNEPSTDGGVNVASEGTFTLEATLSTPPMGDLCEDAVALTLGTPLMNQDLDAYGNDYAGSSLTCGHTSSPDVAYSVTVPSGEVLAVTVTPNGMWDPALSISEDIAECGMTCLDSVDVGFDGDPEVYRYANNTGAPKTLYVVVDGYTAASRTFTISATSAPPPAGDRCETASALIANAAAVSATTVGFSNDYENQPATTTCSSGYLDADRAFTFSVDAGVRAVITVTPAADAGFNPSINFIEGAASACAAMPRVCATGGNGAGTNAAETVRFFNGSGATKSFFAIVDSATSPGDFTIQYTTDIPASDDVCSDTMSTLTNGVVAMGNLVGYEADYTFGVGCPTSQGPDRVYRAQLAANEKLSLVVAPTGVDGGFDPVVKFIPGMASACDTTPRTCAGGSNFAGGNAPETAAFTNNTTASANVFVVVADVGAANRNRTFSVTPTIAAASMGESCAVPQTLTAGMLLAQTLTGASGDVSYAPMATGCEASNGRPDRVYSAVVPNNQTLTVAVTPTAAANLAVNIVDGPATACLNVAACLDSADTLGSSTMPETVSWQNTTGASKTVFVQVVSSPDTTTAASINATFSLNTTIQ